MPKNNKVTPREKIWYDAASFWGRFVKGIAGSISFPGRQPGISASLWLAIDRGNWFEIRGAMECIGNQIFLPSRVLPPPQRRRLFFSCGLSNPSTTKEKEKEKEVSLSLSLSLYPPFPLSLSPFGYSQNGKRVIETMAVRYIFLQNSLLSPPVSGAARVELSSRPKFLRPLWREYRSEKRKRE